MTKIPTIDLKSSDKSKLVQQVRSACIDVGFFYLQGHEIQQDFMDKVFQETKKLFDLPLREKQALSDKALSRGYTAMEEEILDPDVQTKGDTKEGYYISEHIPKDDPRYDPSKLHGPNQWPTKEQLPNFQGTMEEYRSKASDVGFQVVQLLALALGLDKNHFDNAFTEPSSTLRLLHYAQEKSIPAEGVFACGAHSDYDMLTLLLTDDNPGLQIYYKNEWIDVPPRPCTYIVNLGDMLERWTNGLFKSTMHRVLTHGDAERYSIPFFYGPAFDTVVECLDVCTSDTNPPKYPPTTAGRHLLDKYLQTHCDFEFDPVGSSS